MASGKARTRTLICQTSLSLVAFITGNGDGKIMAGAVLGK